MEPSSVSEPSSVARSHSASPSNFPMQSVSHPASKKRHSSVVEDKHTLRGPPRKSARLQGLRTQKPVHLYEKQFPTQNKKRGLNHTTSVSPKNQDPKGRRVHWSSIRTKKQQQAESPLIRDNSAANRSAPTSDQQAAKQQVTSNGEDCESRISKLQNRGPAPCERPATALESFVADWLVGRSRSWSCSSSVADPLVEVPEDMPAKYQFVLPSPRNSFADSDTTSVRKSEKASASVHDVDYRDSLRLRNIYIEREHAPHAFMQRAHRIISRLRASPEMDDIAAQAVIDKSRRYQEHPEEDIIQQLVPDIIGPMDDSRLARRANSTWTNCVPVPLDASLLEAPLPLPRPVPDLTVGYSETAFNSNQLSTIRLLKDPMGRNYGVPDKIVRLPFLTIEFKAQSRNGTHFLATNQTAGAGAIAMNGTLELISRSFGRDAYDFNEPQFFSVTMDHESARINAHWLKAPSDQGQYSFHVEGLTSSFFHEPDGLRKIVRSIKNIVEYGSDTRLRNLCKALDVYRERILGENMTRSAEDQNYQSTLISPDEPLLRASVTIPPTLPIKHSRSKGTEIHTSIQPVAPKPHSSPGVRPTRSSFKPPAGKVKVTRGKKGS